MLALVLVLQEELEVVQEEFLAEALLESPLFVLLLLLFLFQLATSLVHCLYLLLVFLQPVP